MIIHQQRIESKWKEENILPFNELILSWNAGRPIKGRYLFYVSVKIEEWTNRVLYACWGHEGQTGFLETSTDECVRVYQDTLEVMKHKNATGFKIKIITEDGASLEGIRSLNVYTNGDVSHELKDIAPTSKPIYLQVHGISQITLNHPRHRDLCSPASTTAVIRYLLNHQEIDPLEFAKNVCDSGFDIYGNWVFNISQAAHELGQEWNCWVERLRDFDDIYQRLQNGTPVIVSVRGPLPGSAFPYANGHLIAVIGYEPTQQKVICMDPAFPSNDQTHVFYDLSDFIRAWTRRGKVAYVFSKN